MANVQIPFVVRSPSTGQAIVGATVTVTIHATGGAATMYQDAAGTMPLVGNSYTTDGNGAASYGGNPIYIGTNEYDFQVSGPLLSTYTVRREIIAATRAWRDARSYTLPGDQQTTQSSGVVVASMGIALEPGQTANLYGVKHLCVTVGGTASQYKLQTDHASRGTLADVTLVGGGTTITPSNAGYVEVDALSSIALSDGDWVAITCVTTGSSKGPSVMPIIRYTST